MGGTCRPRPPLSSAAMKPTLPQELSWGSRRGILKSGDPREPFYIVIQAVCCWDKQMREFKRRENFFCFMESELMVHGFWLHCCWARRRQNIIAERCRAKLFTLWCLEKGERRDRRRRERKRRGRQTNRPRQDSPQGARIPSQELISFELVPPLKTSISSQ